MGVTQTKVKGPMLYTFHLPHKSLATCQCKSMRLLKTADKKQKNGNFGECDVHLVKFRNGVDEPTLGEYGSDKVLLKVSLNYIINGEIVYKIKNRSCRHEIWQHQGTTRRCVMWFEENDKFESFLEQLRKILCDIILCTTVEEPFYNFTIVIVQRGNQTRTNDDYTNRIEASHKLHRATTFYTLDEDIQARYVGERLKQTPRTNKDLSESQDNLTAENLSILDTTNTSVKPIPTPRTTIKLMQEAEVEKKYLDSLSNPDINFDYESDTEVYSAHVDVSLKTEDKRVELEPPDMADVALHAELLQMSINSRDKKQVHNEIETLINYRALVSVEATSVWPENSDTFRIKVNIEDKDTSGKFIKLKVMKIDTIADLKNKMFIKHGLAKEIQHWIVGDAVPAENVSLGDLGVTGPEYSLFLYLASQKLKGDTRVPASTTDVMDVPKPKNDGSKRKRVKSAKQQEMDKISFVQMQQNGGVGSPKDEHIQLLTAEEKELKCANKVSTTSCLEASTEHDDTGKRVFENKSHNGWMCPSCTFHNYATRPGCEQCSCPRPEDYVVPDDNVVPPEERRRMELESKAVTDFAREKESICANKVSTTSCLEASTEHDDTGKRVFENKSQINKFKQQKLKRKPQEKNIVKVVTVEKELKCANKVSTTSCLKASTEHDDTGKRVFENKSKINNFNQQKLKDNVLVLNNRMQKLNWRPQEKNIVKMVNVNGWMCPSCTFHNYATRPGCEQCSCLRPEDYVVPDDNVVPPEERRRMELESKADTDFAREKESICANKVSTISCLEASTEHDDTGKRVFKNKSQINKFKQQKLKRKPQEKNIVKVVTVNGWMCPSCTFHNYATRPGCEQCSCLRPEDYVVPDDNVVPPEERRRIELESKADTDFARAEERIKFDKDAQRRLNCKALEDAEHRGLILNTKLFECPVCFDNITIGKGVILRECLHQFCKDCLAGAVRNNEEVQIQCPFQDDTFACGASILDLEVKELVTDDIFDKYMARRLAVAEAQVPNSFHCKTVDCKGFCIYDDNVNIFVCMVCHKHNCLTCKVIHEGINCKEYQDNLKLRKDADVAAKQSLDFLDEMVKIGEAMHCPQCKIVIQKKSGCDGIQCSVCKTEICWATKGPRWGPNGHGDRSGGCNCSVEKRCHPNCRNCH